MKSRFRTYTYIYILLCCIISCNKEAPQGALDWHTEERHTGNPSDYAITIDQLEEYTGIDFFCNFPDKVEEAIEARCMPSLWGL